MSEPYHLYGRVSSPDAVRGRAVSRSASQAAGVAESSCRDTNRTRVTERAGIGPEQTGRELGLDERKEGGVKVEQRTHTEITGSVLTYSEGHEKDFLQTRTEAETLRHRALCERGLNLNIIQT